MIIATASLVQVKYMLQHIIISWIFILLLLKGTFKVIYCVFYVLLSDAAQIETVCVVYAEATFFFYRSNYKLARVLLHIQI